MLTSKRPALSLVGGTESPAASCSELQFRRRLALQAIRPHVLNTRRGAFSAMMRSLGQNGQQLEFVHERLAPTKGTPTYRFFLEACANSQQDCDALLSTAHQGMGMMSDVWAFSPASVECEKLSFSHAWQGTLGASRVIPLPGPYDAPVIFAPGNGSHFALPGAKEDFPSWALTSLLNEDLGLPEKVQLRLRVRRRVLTASECLGLLSLSHRLHWQSLVPFQPGSPLTCFSVDRELRDPLLALISTWLKEPNGYCLDVLVHADGEITELSLNRLLEDMLGEFSYETRTIDSNTPFPPVPAELQNCRHVTQSLPAIFADPTLLPAMGVSRLYPTPQRLCSSGVALGTVVKGDGRAIVRLPDEDMTSHIATSGSSGSGKSTFLLSVLAQHMASADRHGAALIDPHGTLFHDALKLVPKDRLKDVIVFDVDDLESVMSFNPFAGTRNNPNKANFVANSIVSLNDALIEENNSSGPGGRAYTKMVLKVITSIPDRDPTFLDALRALEEPDFLSWLESKCKDRVVLAQLANFRKQTGDQSFQNWVGYLTPKLTHYAQAPQMRRLVNNPLARFDIEAGVRDGRIMLFNLSQATLGAVETRILGNLVLNSLFYAAMQRGDIRMHGGKPFHLVVDEAASLCTESMLPMWSQARKFGLSILTANQNQAQLRGKDGNQNLSEGMLANVSTKVFFRLGANDADRLAPYTRPLQTTDMVELPTFHAAVNMMAEGQPVPTFVMKVHRRKPQPSVHAAPEEVIAHSRQAFGTPMGEVVKLLCRAFDFQEGDVAPPVVKELGGNKASLQTVPEQKLAVNFLNRLNKGQSKPGSVEVEDVGPPGARVHRAWVDAVQSQPGFVYPDDLKALTDAKLIDSFGKQVPSRDALLDALTRYPDLSVRTRNLLRAALLTVNEDAWKAESRNAG